MKKKSSYSVVASCDNCNYQQTYTLSLNDSCRDIRGTCDYCGMSGSFHRIGPCDKTVDKPDSAGMTFMEAVQAMKKGKEVRRHNWAGHRGIKIGPLESGGNGMMWANAQTSQNWLASINCIEATDWQIVK